MSSFQNHSKGGREDCGPLIIDALKNLQYGEVHVKVHESRVMQIERLERIRLPDSGSESEPRRTRTLASWTPRPVRVAIPIAVAVVIGAFVFLRGGTPVVAAPATLAQLHRDLVTGHVPIAPVSTIQQANHYLTSEWSDAPPLPDPTAATVTSCCKQNLQDRKVACVLLEYDSQQVTMMVGHSREVVCGARHMDVMVHGRHYGVHEADGLQMVMIENKGRWVCLMSTASVETLLTLAEGLRF